MNTPPPFHRCLKHGHHEWDEDSTCYSLWHARGRYGLGPVPPATDRHLCPCCGLLVTAAVFEAWTGHPPRVHQHVGRFLDPSDDVFANREHRGPR